MIGGYGGTRQVIRKTVEGDDLFEKVQLKDLISEENQSRVLIQMTKGLLIKITHFKPFYSIFHFFFFQMV